MKTSQISNTKFNNNCYPLKSSKQQNFTGLGTGVVTLMDGIDRGGLATSFIIQDVGGTCFPRTWSGLHRNEDVTGKLNYQEATEVALREFITGPSMFAIPMALLYACKKSIGKALDVPMKHIENFSSVLEKSNLLTADNIKDSKTFKGKYYKEVFKNILETSTNGLTAEQINTHAQDFAQGLLKIEEAKSKGLMKNIRNIPVASSREDLTGALVERFLKLTKNSNGDASRDLYIASVSNGKDNFASAKIHKTFGMLTNYTEDVLNKANKSLKEFDANSVKSFISNFSKSRIGGRFMLNIGLFASVVAFCSIVPKIYIRNKQFPGLNGLETQNSNVNNSQRMVENENK